jgi:hypothetical protein
MKAQKNILFTFDYELFLGESSGSVQKCMLEPTEKLISIFDSFQIKHAIFFVDTTYLLRLKQESVKSKAAQTDYNLIKNQLQTLIQKEHYIFPHIHPHWLDATYLESENKWQLLDLSKYRFHAISSEQRTQLFDASIALLKEIIMPANSAYKIDGYRAGGWCIQPFSDFDPHFKKHHIRYDFSVLAGMKNKSTAQFYDFENAPKKSIYNFETDVIQENEAGSYTQLAISVSPIPEITQIITKFLLKYLWRMGNRSYGDGRGVVASQKDDLPPQKTNLEMISMELLTAAKLGVYKRFVTDNPYMHFISHPKMLSPHNLYAFKKFIQFVLASNEMETDFRKMLNKK